MKHELSHLPSSCRLMPRQLQQQSPAEMRSATGEDDAVNGEVDGDEIMEEEVEQEGYGELSCVTVCWPCLDKT